MGSEMKNPQPVQLDEIDSELLRHLQADARITNAELAAKVGIAASTCLQRVRNLVSTGVIEGFHAKVNPKAAGHELQVLISVSLRATARQQLSGFMDEMKSLPEVQQVFFLGGAEDFILHLATTDSEHVREFVLANLSANPSVASTRTNIIFEHSN
jgi:DNA-binding Lrp family transcriptional regulator